MEGTADYSAVHAQGQVDVVAVVTQLEWERLCNALMSCCLCVQFNLMTGNAESSLSSNALIGWSL